MLQLYLAPSYALNAKIMPVHEREKGGGGKGGGGGLNESRPFNVSRQKCKASLWYAVNYREEMMWLYLPSSHSKDANVVGGGWNESYPCVSVCSVCIERDWKPLYDKLLATEMKCWNCTSLPRIAKMQIENANTCALCFGGGGLNDS